MYLEKEPIMYQLVATTPRPGPWNKGKLVGQKLPFKLKEIWAIRICLQLSKSGLVPEPISRSARARLKRQIGSKRDISGRPMSRQSQQLPHIDQELASLATHCLREVEEASVRRVRAGACRP